MDSRGLTDLERELLELCAIAPNMGETTVSLQEEMLQGSYDRQAVEGALRGLVSRGLMTTSKGTFAGTQRLKDGRVVEAVYDDDWWIVSDKGRKAIGLPPVSTA